MKDYFRKVPPQLVKQFKDFRQAHALKPLVQNGVSWEYLVTGEPSGKPLLLLPGALSSAESAWRTISLILSPTRPTQQLTFLGRMSQMVTRSPL